MSGELYTHIIFKMCEFLVSDCFNSLRGTTDSLSLVKEQRRVLTLQHQVLTLQQRCHSLRA